MEQVKNKIPNSINGCLTFVDLSVYAQALGFIKGW